MAPFGPIANGGGWTKAGRQMKAVLDIVASLMVIVAAGAVLFLVVDRGGASSPPAQRELHDEIPVSKSLHYLDGAHLLGSRQAPVAIVQYSDFQCQFCGQFAREIWPMLKAQYVNTGRVLFGFRHLPLPRHEHAQPAALASRCAAEQNHFWQLHDKLFADVGPLTAAKLAHSVESLTLDRSAFDECVHTHSGSDITSDGGYAVDAGVRGTPTFLIGRLDSERNTVDVTRIVVGVQPLSRLVEAIESVSVHDSAWRRWSKAFVTHRLFTQ